MFFWPSNLQQAPLYAATGILKWDMRSQSRCLFSSRLELSIVQGSFLPPQSAPAVLAVLRFSSSVFLIKKCSTDRTVSAVFCYNGIHGTFIMEPFKAVIHDIRILQCTALSIHRHCPLCRHCALCAVLPKTAFKLSCFKSFFNLLERLVFLLLRLFGRDNAFLQRPIQIAQERINLGFMFCQAIRHRRVIFCVLFKPISQNPHLLAVVLFPIHKQQFLRLCQKLALSCHCISVE